MLQSNRNVYATKSSAVSSSNECPPPPVIKYSSSGYSLANPLLLNDGREESNDLSALKSNINELIQQKIQIGEITTASIYFRNLNESKWMSINTNEVYSPASLLKVPILMVYLHDLEKNPSLLKKEIYYYPALENQFPVQTYEGKTIQPGKKYTILELLNLMIIHSDNAATTLLNMNLNEPEFKKLFSDLGLIVPDLKNSNYEITVAGYSRFMRVLYNATYLTQENSDFALKLLSKVDYKEGIIKNIPQDIIVAHKFGEFGKKLPGGKYSSQLHESGIFFYKDKPYLLTVMTKGPNPKVLSNVLAEISGEVFKGMN